MTSKDIREFIDEYDYMKCCVAGCTRNATYISAVAGSGHVVYTCEEHKPSGLERGIPND